MPVIDEIAAERQRQIEVEGFDDKHDDLHCHGDLSCAAAAYAGVVSTALDDGVVAQDYGDFLELSGDVPIDWPWDPCWWKPSTPRHDLIKAAALIVAQIERLDREAAEVASKSP